MKNFFDGYAAIVAWIFAFIGMAAYWVIGVPLAGLIAGWILARDYVMDSDA